MVKALEETIDSLLVGGSLRSPSRDPRAENAACGTTFR